MGVIFALALGGAAFPQLMRGVIETNPYGMLLLGVGIGRLRVLKSDGPRPHGFIWSTDRVKKMKVYDPAHYIPLVCGGGPHYQSSAPRDSGAYYNPLVCGEGPHYQSSAPRDSGA